MRKLKKESNLKIGKRLNTHLTKDGIQIAIRPMRVSSSLIREMPVKIMSMTVHPLEGLKLRRLTITRFCKDVDNSVIADESINWFITLENWQYLLKINIPTL